MYRLLYIPTGEYVWFYRYAYRNFDCSTVYVNKPGYKIESNKEEIEELLNFIPRNFCNETYEFEIVEYSHV